MKAFVLLLVVFGLVVPGVAEPVKIGPTLKEQLQKKKLSTVFFPKVEFEAATFDEAMEVLEMLYTKEVKGEIELQWVYQGFERKTLKSAVTISGEKISAGKMLQEITRQCGLTAKLDEHAIVLSAKKAASVPVREPAEKAAEPEKATEPPATGSSPLKKSTLDSRGLDRGKKK